MHLFTVAFFKMHLILSQHRLLREDYSANHRSIQIFRLFESIINSVVRLPRSRGIFESRVISKFGTCQKNLGTRLIRDGRLNNGTDFWSGVLRITAGFTSKHHFVFQICVWIAYPEVFPCSWKCPSIFFSWGEGGIGPV